jgi:hypothetical protein
MQRTPSEIVYAVGNIVADALREPVEAALRNFYGPGWQDHLPRSVRVRDGSVHWDAAAVLHTVRHAWRDVFQARCGEDGKHFAGELIGARNRAAHPNLTEKLSTADAARALDTASRLLRSMRVAAHPTLEALRAELRAPAVERRREMASAVANASVASANTYEARRLTFRAEVIEALRDDESFRVVTPAGTFEMTKAAFYRSFPNVVASRSYIDAGLYHYPTIPAKALPFLLRATDNPKL